MGSRKENWPSKRRPYQEEMEFREGEGKVTHDGKAYWPVLLRVKIPYHRGLRILQEIANGLQGRAEAERENGFEFYLSGEIETREEEQG